ncbi:MAG: carboxylesterase/lipase family protein [Firmicutes bacterium]|nr:carboxylesterase/lipase family protein [Bacillota bacterium]
MKRVLVLLALVLAAGLILCSCGNAETDRIRVMEAKYGENHAVTGPFDEAESVRCENGTFVGSELNGVLSFKGVPYAKQPVGDLRWKPPVQPDPDEGIYEALYYGKSPVQTRWPSEPGSYYPCGEDCLTLNVWTASGEERDKAVMVFFHGGDYGWGSTTDPVYDGQQFVETHPEIVLVTVEYRLGILGFIDLSSVPGGEEYPESGNLGLLDMKCSLEWIGRNIGAFGGDPENVTIFGESAGGGAVSLLPLMDGTKGLFRRVIAESGSLALTSSREECGGLTERLLKETGAESMADLMALSEDELKKANEALNDYCNRPERDGVVLPEDLYEAWKRMPAEFDLMIGTNADEVNYWKKEVGYMFGGFESDIVFHGMETILYENDLKRFSAEDRTAAEAFVKDQGGVPGGLSEFYNEVMFRIPAVAQARAHGENGGKTYMYYWTYPSAIPGQGACHAVELSYVFNNPEETLYTGDITDPVLSAEVQRMWVNFARTGDPSTETHPWKAYGPQDRWTMVLGKDIRLEKDLMEDRYDALESFPGYYLSADYMEMEYGVPYVYKRIGVLALAAVLLAVFFILRRKRKKA